MINEPMQWTVIAMSSHYFCCTQNWHADIVILTQLNCSLGADMQVWKIAVIDQGWHSARYGSVIVVSHTLHSNWTQNTWIDQ